MLERNIMVLNLQEASASFWTAVHKGFSLGFLTSLALHALVILLFKVRYHFW